MALNGEHDFVVPDQEPSERFRALWDWTLQKASSADIDKPVVGALRRFWKKNWYKFPDDIKRSFLESVQMIGQTQSNAKSASNHSLWKVTITNNNMDFDWGVWLVLRAIYYDGVRTSKDIKVQQQVLNFQRGQSSKLVQERYPGVDVFKDNFPLTYPPRPSHWPPLPSSGQRNKYDKGQRLEPKPVSEASPVTTVNKPGTSSKRKRAATDARRVPLPSSPIKRKRRQDQEEGDATQRKGKKAKSGGKSDAPDALSRRTRRVPLDVVASQSRENSVDVDDDLRISEEEEEDEARQSKKKKKGKRVLPTNDTLPESSDSSSNSAPSASGDHHPQEECSGDGTVEETTGGDLTAGQSDGPDSENSHVENNDDQLAKTQTDIEGNFMDAEEESSDSDSTISRGDETRGTRRQGSQYGQYGRQRSRPPSRDLKALRRRRFPTLSPSSGEESGGDHDPLEADPWTNLEKKPKKMVFATRREFQDAVDARVLLILEQRGLIKRDDEDDNDGGEEGANNAVEHNHPTEGGNTGTGEGHGEQNGDEDGDYDGDDEQDGGDGLGEQDGGVEHHPGPPREIQSEEAYARLDANFDTEFHSDATSVIFSPDKVNEIEEELENMEEQFEVVKDTVTKHQAEATGQFTSMQNRMQNFDTTCNRLQEQVGANHRELLNKLAATVPSEKWQELKGIIDANHRATLQKVQAAEGVDEKLKALQSQIDTNHRRTLQMMKAFESTVADALKNIGGNFNDYAAIFKNNLSANLATQKESFETESSI